MAGGSTRKVLTLPAATHSSAIASAPIRGRNSVGRLSAWYFSSRLIRSIAFPIIPQKHGKPTACFEQSLSVSCADEHSDNRRIAEKHGCAPGRGRARRRGG